MEIKTRIIDLLKSTERENIDSLIAEMEYIGFFEAPCSGGYHLCKEGGLAEHSLNVCETAMKMCQALDRDDLMDSAVISALLHDLGKCGDYGKKYYVENTLKSGKVSDAKPYKRNDELLEKNHAIKSVILANRFIDLTEDEEYAILHHDGLYERANYDISGNETPLLCIIHWSDMWSSRFIEVENVKNT